LWPKIETSGGSYQFSRGDLGELEYHFAESADLIMKMFALSWFLKFFIARLSRTTRYMLCITERRHVSLLEYNASYRMYYKSGHPVLRTRRRALS